MRISAARDFRTQKEERRARSMKKDSDDHGGKMLPCQASGVRRMGREGRESRVQRSSVQGREVLIVIVIVIVIMLRKKPARGSTRAREHERTRALKTSAWSARGREFADRPPPCVRAFANPSARKWGSGAPE